MIFLIGVLRFHFLFYVWFTQVLKYIVISSTAIIKRFWELIFAIWSLHNRILLLFEFERGIVLNKEKLCSSEDRSKGDS